MSETTGFIQNACLFLHFKIVDENRGGKTNPCIFACP
jgi:hypothetical protein